MQSLKDILNCTHQKRRSLNAAYSRNAFARDLGVSPTALSQFLSGKRAFSKTNLRRIGSSLCLPPGWVERHTTDSKESRKATEIKLDTFSLIAEWHHFAILNLIEIESTKSASKIANRLGITKDLAISAVDRLLNLGFIKKENGFLKRTQTSLDAGTDIPSEALRKHNREKMELAIEALEKTHLTLRDISSLTLTFDPQNMQQIKKEINRFKQRIDSLCAPASASEVYSLNIQFFPLSKKESAK